jgi:hypothetical protein
MKRSQSTKKGDTGTQHKHKAGHKKPDKINKAQFFYQGMRDAQVSVNLRTESASYGILFTVKGTVPRKSV